ncbi:MAG TPA: HdeD family acid-resistance protein [Chiayiivirga sp.]|nr:HdeD family acid-resistance protein [Chiayiivirga sp.]
MQTNEQIGNSPSPESLRRNWGWILAAGILLLVLGFVGLFMTGRVTLVSVVTFGILLIVGGVGQLVTAFMAKGWQNITWHVLVGLLYLAAGALILINPGIATMSLTLIIAAILVVVGIVRSVSAFQTRPAKGWGWMLFGGIVTVLLGILLAVQWPVSGLFAIGLFISIELIVAGWNAIWLALAAAAPVTSPQGTTMRPG